MIRNGRQSVVVRYRRREGVLLSLVGAGFVLLGIALRDEVPWYATAFFGLCMTVGVVQVLRPLAFEVGDGQHLTIDDIGITRTAHKVREHVAWGDIERVRILTTDRGPYSEDVFFVIDGKGGTGCAVGQDLAVRAGLLEALQARLEGVDNAAVIEAMGSFTNRELTIWRAPGVA